MGRVETRMYRRKKQRSKLLQRTVLILVLLLGTVLLLRKYPSALVIERLGGPTATPLTSAYDQTVERREVTLAEECWYAIQTGVFSTEEAARQKADAYLCIFHDCYLSFFEKLSFHKISSNIYSFGC